MRTRKLLFLATMVIFSLVSCKDEYPDLGNGLYAKFDTSKGAFLAELYYKQTPITVSSFVSLAEGSNTMVDSAYKGKKYYDGLIFHRVIDGFVIQGGDPTGTGSGGPGYKFPDEFVDSLSHDSAGILSMANAGPGTNGSQFFITLAPTQNLDGRHAVFGKVIEGMDVVDSIGKVETGPRDKPKNDVTINHIEIIRKGNDAENFDAPKIFQKGLQQEKEEQAAKAEKMKAAQEENVNTFEKAKKESKSLDSGLAITMIEEGNGEQPKNGDAIKVSYEGYFTDGRIFDTSKENLAKEMGIFSQQRKDQNAYGPMTTTYGPDAPMIAGFKEGLEQMKVGDEAWLFIPSHLAYGENGAGNAIPPNTDLIFKVKIEGMADSNSK